MSRDPRRISRVLAELEALWRLYPDWRLGQLIVNVNPRQGGDGFYVEDEEWIAALKAAQYEHDSGALPEPGERT